VATDVAHSAGRSITGISSMATRTLLAELSAQYEQRTGRRVAVESVGGVDAVRRIDAGETFDFVVLAGSAIDKLAATGRVVPASRVDIARSRIAIAVPAGVRRPDLGSERAVRDAVLAARRIGYSTGPSGEHLAKLLQRWGVADAVAARMVKAPPGVPVGALVARGEADIGFQQLSELMNMHGVDVAATLPPEIQEVTVFTGAVCASSEQRAGAAAWLDFCASSQADAIKHKLGMEP
jgi:molybdate transport system substrate-binding protein